MKGTFDEQTWSTLVELGAAPTPVHGQIGCYKTPRELKPSAATPPSSTLPLALLASRPPARGARLAQVCPQAGHPGHVWSLDDLLSLLCACRHSTLLKASHTVSLHLPLLSLGVCSRPSHSLDASSTFACHPACMPLSLRL